ncbi:MULTISPECIES: hypothetical protein [unclassified Pseudoxanthomonas]|uniref:hypothetical protein n=1 Tax=unclassified Pseudoxanthomonas TaxID=2645906 RepID=UPI0030780DD0
MRAIVIFALVASLSFAANAQTSSKSEIYALDALSDHTARVGASSVFVYQTKGGNLGKFLLGGAFLNSRAMTQRSESIANTIDDEVVVQDFGSIGQVISEKDHDNLIKAHAVLLSVDSDGVTRATLVVHTQNAESEANYFYHFKPTLPNSELQSESRSAFFKAIQDETPAAIDSLVVALGHPLSSGQPTKAKSDFMRIYGKITIPFKGERYADVGDLSVAKIDGKPGAIRFGLIDGVHLFHASQVEYN